MLHKYEVGQLYNAQRTQWPEVVDYNYRGGEHEMLGFFTKLQPSDIEAWRAGQMHLGIVEVMTDASTGIIQVLRAVTWASHLTHKLHNAIMRQLSRGPLPDYDARLQSVYKRYPETADLVSIGSTGKAGTR